MVKLVIADMDGTLLNSEREIPTELFDVIRRLSRNDIRFVIASGRQYYNLRSYFPGMENMVSYIAENGALIFESDKNIYSKGIRKEYLTEALSSIRGVEGTYPIFCGIKSAYIEDNDPLFQTHAKMYNRELKHVSDLMSLNDDVICKIAVFDHIDAETNSYPVLRCFGSSMQVTLSGNDWVDLTETGVNKGRAVQFLQEKYHVTPSESMAFGDYLNDSEMMMVCDYSYAMENAHPNLKELCRRQTLSNDENGVIKAIRAYFDDESGLKIFSAH